eukprot:TRINITY_DN7566_c0_g1_i1.p1 TRINITY_DN7566_c0_g1~~TRINITY_DN7566_c0_g1_i1.p1  ORF type:complete len:505 (+),score=55.60 TRINITY_DN7566_c0_g1_i1:128-1642(+)
MVGTVPAAMVTAEDHGIPEARGWKRRRALIVGGGLAGLAAARTLRRQFDVTVVDAKEFFEFGSGILRAYASPCTWDRLTFCYHEVLEHRLRVRFICGEVVNIDGPERCARIRTMFSDEEDEVLFDFCLIAGGCGFQNLVGTVGASPWMPQVHEKDRTASEFHRKLDERYLEGRRRHVLHENLRLQALNEERGQVVIVGAGFLGVEWACELQFAFPQLRITLVDFLPCCLGPLPEAAQEYCQRYMENQGIATYYSKKFDPANPKFYQSIGVAGLPDKVYVIQGLKSTTHFMPPHTLSDRGPGGGGWITTDRYLRIVTRSHLAWGSGTIFAAGDCTAGFVLARSRKDPSTMNNTQNGNGSRVAEVTEYDIPPIPKTGYSAELQAVHAAKNIQTQDLLWYGVAQGVNWWNPFSWTRLMLRPTWYPWGSGIFAISLGPRDGCVVMGASERPNSGSLVATGALAVVFKELIENTKMSQSRGNDMLSSAIWWLIHNWPLNFVGHGPCCRI